MIFSRHRFTRIFSAPAAHEAPLIEEEMQQAQLGAATAEVAPQRQAVAQPRVEVFNQRAAAWRTLHGLRDRGPGTVELAPHGGMQPVPALPECARCVRHCDAADTWRGPDSPALPPRARWRPGCASILAGEGEQVVVLVLQGDAHRADA